MLIAMKSTPSLCKKKNRAQQAKQALPDLITILDVEIREPNWCSTILSSLLKYPRTHDVTFKTSDGGIVSALRAIVAAGSPVLIVSNVARPD